MLLCRGLYCGDDWVRVLIGFAQIDEAKIKKLFLSSHHLHQGLNSEDQHRSLQVVSQHMQAHLCADPRHGSGKEMR